MADGHVVPMVVVMPEVAETVSVAAVAVETIEEPKQMDVVSLQQSAEQAQASLPLQLPGMHVATAVVAGNCKPSQSRCNDILPTLRLQCTAKGPDDRGSLCFGVPKLVCMRP